MKQIITQTKCPKNICIQQQIANTYLFAFVSISFASSLTSEQSKANSTTAPSLPIQSAAATTATTTAISTNSGNSKSSRHYHHRHHHYHHHHHHHMHHRLSIDSTASTNGGEANAHNGTATAKKEKTCRRTTRLSSDLIAKLNLRPGPNEIQYSVTTALQGTTRIVSYVFLWTYTDKVIISDIDGTITKSDVWGHVLPVFGLDWSQAGVADHFTAIERNEYKFIYLSARAIGQSKLTRDLLRSINQGGFTLPEGPLLVTPTSLFTAFRKEVIEKKPEVFKINCLKDIQSLFPDNPYYAGYGNKSTDVTAYKTVGIPEARIFTINPQGELKHEVSRSFQSSYSKVCDYVDMIFPPFTSGNLTKPEYDTFSYWRDTPHADFLDEIDKEINATIKNSSSSSTAKTTAAGATSQQQQSSPGKEASTNGNATTESTAAAVKPPARKNLFRLSTSVSTSAINTVNASVAAADSDASKAKVNEP